MTTWYVEAFYDGDCPLCVREVNLLRRLDRKRQRIRWTDIAAPDFDAQSTGKTLRVLDDDTCRRLAPGFQASEKQYVDHFKAMMRVLDREEPDYRN